MTIKTGILVDPMGHDFGEVTDDQEIAEHVKDYSELMRPHTLDWYKMDSMADVKVGTKLLLFDYGGMMGFGSGDLVGSIARSVLRWASDHPSSLVVVMSDFTYRNTIRYELEEMGLSLHNVVVRQSINEDPIPYWFRFGNQAVPILAKAIAGLTSCGGTFPDMQWFDPLPRFIAYMKDNFSSEFLYEVGAGMGHTAKALSEAGIYSVKAIDANRRPGAVFKIEIEDATDYDYRMEPIVLMCRPCHGPFVEAVIHRALFKRARGIVYVGLPKNVANDLGSFRKYFKCVLRKAGAEGESVYEWKPEWNQDVEKPKRALKAPKVIE